MNVKIGTEAAQFPEKEYINGIFLAVLQSRRLQHIYHARVNLNPMPESTLSPSQGHWIWPQWTIAIPLPSSVSNRLTWVAVGIKMYTKLRRETS
jgi:hypothetical protein